MSTKLKKCMPSLTTWRLGSSSHWFIESKNLRSLNILRSRENFKIRIRRVSRDATAWRVVVWNAAMMCADGTLVVKSIQAQPLT